MALAQSHKLRPQLCHWLGTRSKLRLLPEKNEWSLSIGVSAFVIIWNSVCKIYSITGRIILANGNYVVSEAHVNSLIHVSPWPQCGQQPCHSLHANIATVEPTHVHTHNLPYPLVIWVYSKQAELQFQTNAIKHCLLLFLSLSLSLLVYCHDNQRQSVGRQSRTVTKSVRQDENSKLCCHIVLTELILQW